MPDKTNTFTAKTKVENQKSPPKKHGKIDILFFRLGEAEFCARKDEILDITGGNIIYHLPLTPAYFDGVVDLDGKTSYVFDLAALIGIPSSGSAHEGILLVASRKDPAAAFRIDEVLNEINLPQDAVTSMPGYLKSDFIDTCAIYEERLIPVVNLTKILKSIASENLHHSAPSLTCSQPRPVKKNLPAEEIRLFCIGKETFATTGLDPAAPLFKLKNITPIPGSPDFVLGISLFQDSPMTIIDVSKRIGRQLSEEKKVLISNIDNNLFGFTVDADKKALKTGKVKALDLPCIASREWMTKAILKGKEIVPLLNLPALLAPEIPLSKEQMAKKYKPDSSFEQSFLKEELKVTELMLMGRHHAVPSKEVKDVVPLKPYRALPAMPSILTGVSEHDGNLLPVIDIEACFGTRSNHSKGWKMVLIENGDFSAFVLTEAVLEERELPCNMHREMPLLMKHRFLYGCYPDNETKMVSLALNVYKMAVYFDEGMIRKVFTPALSKGEKKEEVKGEKTGAPFDGGEILYVNNESRSTDSDEPSELADSRERPVNIIDTPLSSDSKGIDRSIKPENQVEKIESEKLEDLHNNYESAFQPEDTNHVLQNSAKNGEAAFRNRAEETEIESNGYSEETNRDASNTTKWFYIIIIILISAAIGLLLLSGDIDINRRGDTLSRTDTMKEYNNEKESVPPPVSGEMPVSSSGKKKVYSPEKITKGQDISKKTVVEQTAEQPVPSTAKFVDTGNKSITVTGKIPSPSDSLTKEQIKPVAAKSRPAKKWKRNKNKYYPPLGEFDFYTVEEGDTLWDIAEAYSKDPFDYNLVAEDNKIIDPDLIYPGQRLRLQKKWKDNKATSPGKSNTAP